MTVGITGHQIIEPADINWITSQIDSFISQNTITIGISSLAIGADQLFASRLLAKNIDFKAIIPCKGYELTFKTKHDLDRFHKLLSCASEQITLNFEKPTEEAFYSAGIQVSKLSSTMIAIWDGENAKGLGGTADIVNATMLDNKKVYHINPVKRTTSFIND